MRGTGGLPSLIGLYPGVCGLGWTITYKYAPHSTPGSCRRLVHPHNGSGTAPSITSQPDRVSRGTSKENAALEDQLIDT